MVGAAVQDYLKTIYKIASSGRRCTPSLLAARLSVSPAAVTKMTKRLQELRLATYTRNQELALTPAGEKIALEMIRHHRLLELYLMEALGYTWDQVDSEAEKLEHVISEEFEERIDQLLGRPTRDPHGHPIPTRDGRVAEVAQSTLAELHPGQKAVVCRVNDGDPEMLRYLGKIGLYPDTPVDMIEISPYGGPLRVLVSGMVRDIGPELARNVFVAIQGAGA